MKIYQKNIKIFKKYELVGSAQPTSLCSWAHKLVGRAWAMSHKLGSRARGLKGQAKLSRLDTLLSLSVDNKWVLTKCKASI